MRYLTDKKEIAAALNFGKYPVLTINRENNPYAVNRPDSDYAIGCRVRVAWDKADPKYAGMTTHGHLYYENGRLAISKDASIMTNSFGYEDVMEMVAEANTPVVHKGQEVVVVEEWASKRECAVRIMKVSNKIDTLCQTVATLQDIE